jgi:hypothetical protein
MRRHYVQRAQVVFLFDMIYALGFGDFVGLLSRWQKMIMWGRPG